MWNDRMYSLSSYSWLYLKLEMLCRGVIIKRMCVVGSSVLERLPGLGLEEALAT